MNNLLQHRITIDYWLDKTSRFEPVEINATATAGASREPLTQSFGLDGGTAAAVRKICNDKDAGIYVFFLAALQTLIYQYTGAGKNLVACTAPLLSNNDTGPASPLFLGAGIDAEQDSRQLILSLQDQLKEAYQHREYPFEKFKEKYQLLYGPVTPLFNYAFAYIPFTGDRGLSGQRLGEQLPEPAKLSFIIRKTADSFDIAIRYAGNYADWFISRMGEHLLRIVASIAGNPSEKRGAIPLLSAPERQLILETFNDTSVVFPERDLTIIQLFEKRAREYPDQVAVQYGENRVSYRNLQLRSLQLASLLKEKGIGRNSIVAMICERSEHMITGMLGSLKAGAAYVPVDPDIPEERMDYILKDSASRAILTTRTLFASKPTLFAHNPMGVIFLEEITGNPVSADPAPANAPAHSNPAMADFDPGTDPEDTAYIIYTSGSTGRPKGIVILHKGFINLVLAFKSKYASGLTTADRNLALANVAFDASVPEIYMALTSGSTIIVVDKERLFDPPGLAAFIVENGITFAYVPPVLLKDVLHYLRPYGPAIRLDKLFVGVEAIKDTLLYDYCALIKDLDILNAYGPTETTVICSGFNYIPEPPIGENVSIGKPIPNYRVYIVNNSLEPLPIGVTGEVCVAGPGVGRSYLNNEELTAAKFIADPFHPGERMFRTGDLAKWTPDGNIVFVGRKDNQVKIRGYRVELGEIESVLSNHPAIREAVVCAFEDEAGSKYLYAYYVPAPTGEEILTHPDGGMSPGLAGEIRNYLAALVPEYMIPSGFMALDKIPVTSNGKTDRRKLPSPERTERNLEEKDRPSTELERKLAAIWKELLNIQQVGVNDNFFELGGHSLKAARLVTIILRDCKVEVPLRQVFTSGTIRQLASYIQNAASSEQFEILAAPPADHYPASFAQRRLYLSYLLNKEVTNYNMPGAYAISGPVDIMKLQQAFNAITGRQEAFRTGFAVIDGTLVQRVYENAPVEVAVIQADGTDMHGQIAGLIRPFDLGRPPLLRVTLLQQTAEESILFIDMHHIISDGVSIDLLLKELARAWDGEVSSPLKVRYKDYAAWLNQYREAAAFDGQRKYWLEAFSDKQEAVSIPLDHPRPDNSTFEGETITIRIDRGTVSALRKVANEETATLFLLSFAAYYVLLYKYSGQEDMVIGTPVAGRIHPDLYDIIGMFVNTLPIRTALQPGQPFTGLVSQLKETFFKALDNQLYPFEELIEALDLERTGSRNPLFDTLFAYQNMESEALQIRGLSIQAVEIANTTTKFDLSIEVWEAGDELEAAFIYSKELFERSTIERMARHYQTILTRVAQSPQTAVGGISLLEEAEREHLLSTPDEGGSSQADAGASTIPQLFETQVAAVPNSIAVSCNGEVLTYAMLHKRVDELAAVLKGSGLKKGEVVAVLAERNERLIIGLLAILKAGGVYLPVEPNYPAERIAFILQDAACSCILKTGPVPEQVEALIAETGIRILDAAVPHPTQAAASAHLAPTAAGAARLHTAPPEVTAKDAAYIIYTSGSTGKPKGVEVEHGAIVNYIRWAGQYYGRGQAGNMPLFTSVSFDLTLTAIFMPLATGHEVVIYNGIEEGLLIEKIIADNRVDIIKLTPAHLSILNNIAVHPAMEGSRIRAFIVGGEALDTRLAGDIHRKFGGSIAIYNEYGPTEATVGCMIHAFNPEEALPSVPIGKPIANTRIYLLDRDNQLCPIGITGEICIAGAGLARGYMNRPDLTAEKFVLAPFAKEGVAPLEERGKGDLIYRTGDLGRWLPDGNMIFAGRKDEQIKVNGYRIEPGEIGSTLLRYEAIKEAVVIPVEGRGGGRSLAAYFTSPEAIEIPALRGFLAAQLPSYMVPAHFIRVEALPLTSNGKINRKALPKPLAAGNAHVYTPPGNDREAKLLEVWKAILELDGIGITDHFFESGGHSLKALVLVSRIQKLFHIEVTLKDIFNHPTVQTLAQYLGKASRLHFASIARVAKQPHYSLSSAQKRIFVMSHFKGAETSYNMYAAFWVDGPLDVGKLEGAFRSLIGRHESLRTSFGIVEDEPVQIVQDHIDWQLPHMQWSDAGGSTPDNAAIGALVEKFICKFDLAVAPLFRAQVVEWSADRHLILFDMHHIIADGVSLDVFFRELWELYHGRRLPELAIQYKDYAAWQRAFFTTGAIEPQKLFWKGQFEGLLPVLDLPADLPRPLIQTFKGKNYRFQLDARLASGVFDFISGSAVTLNMFMLAVYNILLSKYTSQEDIIVGTPVAGRTHADLEPVIGMFVNTLALRNYPKAGKSFEQFLAEVKVNALNAYENQDYPFEELIDSLNLKRDTSRNPLFDTMFLLMNQKPEQAGEGLRFTTYPVAVNVAKFDLTFEVIQSGEKIEVLVNYNTALFASATVQRLARHFTHIVTQVIANPAVSLRQISLPDEEEVQLLQAFGGIPGKTVRQTIPSLWKEQALKYKERMAVETTHDRLTFEELDHRSSALAAYLKEAYGLKAGDKVAVLLQRTIQLPLTLLAILKTGAAYVPIDPDFPPLRKEYILTNSECSLVITDTPSDHAIPVFNIRTGWHAAPALPGDTPAGPVTHPDSAPLIDPSDLAYMTYTSGSTGMPKGVMIGHSNVVSFTRNLETVFGVNPGDRILAITNITFDISVLEILCSLMAGVSVVLAEDGEVNDFDKIGALTARHQVNVLQLTPSRLSLLLSNIGAGFMSGIKTLLIGGEAMPEELFHVLKGLKRTRVFNVYGPTETCIWSTAGEIQDDRITIGKPLTDEQVIILGTDGQLQPIQVPGEICIAGSGVGKGYFRNEELTAEKFFRDEQLSSAGIYRTGDRGRWLPDGRIEYIGRVDDQVKVRGYRVELGEIENALRRFRGIRMAAAVVADINREKQIVGFYESDTAFSYSAIRVFLAEYLPGYMLPIACIHLPAIPLTSSGKIDRKALEPVAQRHSTFAIQSPDSHQSADSGQPAGSLPYEEPVGAIQKSLVSIWKEILNREQVGVADNFFATGGNSIKLIQVLNRIKKELGVDLPLATAFKYTTIKELAGHIRTMQELGKMHEELPYTLVNPGKKQTIFCFPPFIGYSFLYTVFADYLPDHTLCCFHFKEEDETAEPYLQAMKELQGDQPLVLLGYSVGGNFAFGLTRELESRGQIVSDLILIDSYKRWQAEEKNDEELESLVATHMQDFDLSLFAVDAGYFETLKEKVRRKMLGYARFLNNKMDTGRVDARIHLIRCEEQMDTAIRNRNWEDSTNSECLVYQGKGMHPQMLNPEFLPDNTAHLRTIMQQVKDLAPV